MYDRDSLIALFRQKALKFGQFTLASGKQASYYLDGKQVTLDACGARLVAEGILDLLAAAGPLPAAVGGMSIGADPITAAVITMSAVRGTPLIGFMVRKESKGHGTNRYIEGPVQPGDERSDRRRRSYHGRVVAPGDRTLRGVWAESCPRGGHHRSHGRRGQCLHRPGLCLFQPADDSRLRDRTAERMTKSLISRSQTSDNPFGIRHFPVGVGVPATA